MILSSNFKWIAIIIVILICGGIAGFYLYDKGKRDTELKVQQMELERERIARLEQEEADRIHRAQEAEAERVGNINRLKVLIPQKQAELQMEINRLNDINSFEFGRTPTQKEKQLTNQYEIINELKEELNQMQQSLNSLKAQSPTYVEEKVPQVEF